MRYVTVSSSLIIVSLLHAAKRKPAAAADAAAAPCTESPVTRARVWRVKSLRADTRTTATTQSCSARLFMHTMRPRCRLVVVLVLAALAMPSRAAAVAVSEEAGLRAAVANNSVSEVVVTADVPLTAGHLRVPPGRVLTLRGACGVTNTSSCTLDANSLSRHLHVTPGAEVRVSNLRLVNGAAVNQACDPFTQTMVPGSAASCSPAYFNYGVYVGQLARFPALDEALNYPTLGDEVRPRSPYSFPRLRATVRGTAHGLSHFFASRACQMWSSWWWLLRHTSIANYQ